VFDPKNIEIINYLVSNEIDINHTTKYGYNALFSCDRPKARFSSAFSRKRNRY